MSDKPPVQASEDERQALVQLSESRDRAEADRARAILLELWRKLGDVEVRKAAYRGRCLTPA